MSQNREPKPFFRKSKNAWYLQLGTRQISLGRDKKEAWTRYHQIMADNQPLRETATIEMLFERFLDWVQENRKPGTYDKNQRHLSSFAKFIGKRTKISAVRGSDLSEWVEQEKTWNSTSRNDAIASVIRCFNWAVGKNFLAVNPVSQVPNKPRRLRRETVLSTDEWQGMLAHVKDEPFKDYLTLLWETGCRPLEARRAEARHLDLEAGLIVFPPSEAKGERHERVIYLTPKTLEICRRWAKRFPEGPIMRNTTGRPWTKDAINCRFTRLKKKLGKRVFAYAIRHSYATQGLIDGVDSVTLSQLMGHADVSTLAKNYAHLSKNQQFLKKQAERVRKTA